MKKIVAMMILAGSIQGCSDSAPSNSEVEAAVNDYVAMAIPKKCTGIAVENIAKKNGIKVDEGTYQILAGYEVRILPVAQDDTQLDALLAEQESVKAREKSSADEVMRITSAESGGYPVLPGELIAYPEKASDQVRPFVQQYAEASNRAKELDLEISEHKGSLVNSWGPPECRLVAGNQSAGGFGSEDFLNAIRGGATNSVELELTLVKTDNGWMLAR